MALKDNFNSPAPKWYRRLKSALLLAGPIIVDMMHAWGGIKDSTLSHVALFVANLGGILAVGSVLLGDQQEYAPTGTTDALMQKVPEATTAKEAVRIVQETGPNDAKN